MRTQSELDLMSSEDLARERIRLKSECEGARREVERNRTVKAAREISEIRLRSLEEQLSDVDNTLLDRKINSSAEHK